MKFTEKIDGPGNQMTQTQKGQQQQKSHVLPHTHRQILAGINRCPCVNRINGVKPNSLDQGP